MTAHKLYSGETSVVSLKRLKSLVSFINNSPQTNDKLMDIQRRANPNKRPVKLLTDVKTRWWSVHLMVHRALRLRQSLERLFRQEIINRQQSGKTTPSKLETLQLEEDDYECLKFLDKVLHPFREAQRALEEDQYVSVSLIVIIVKTLYSAMHAMHAAAAADFPPSLECELLDMVEDFVSHWGDPITYAPILVCGFGNRQIGIPMMAYWAALLDPRTFQPFSY